jgi:NADH:ubiquinone oxidoreductase subunit E
MPGILIVERYQKMAVEIAKIDEIIEKNGTEQHRLIPSLLDLQKEFHYLPVEVMERVSERMRIPLVNVFQVASFYKAFSLEPRGKHIITVCLGTACHVRGGVRLIEQVGRLLDIEAGQTTKDMQFTLEAVSCLGCCALGPVMVIDGKYYGSMSASKVEKVLQKYMQAEEVASNGQ